MENSELQSESCAALFGEAFMAFESQLMNKLEAHGEKEHYAQLPLKERSYKVFAMS